MKKLLIAMLLCCACKGDRLKPVPTEGTSHAPPVETGFSPSPCTPSKATLCPVDDAAQDASFAEYRQKLRGAVERKSVEDVIALVDPQIRTSFGEGGGIAAFRKLLNQEPIWKELGEVLALGGSFRREGTDRMFWAPYVYSAWPEDVDAFTYVAATRRGVPLRESPSTSGKTLQSLDWAIVELIPSRDLAWRHVRTSDGKSGWVNAGDVRSPIDFRAGFRRVNGEWKMNAFVAGD